MAFRFASSLERCHEVTNVVFVVTLARASSVSTSPSVFAVSLYIARAASNRQFIWIVTGRSSGGGLTQFTLHGGLESQMVAASLTDPPSETPREAALRRKREAADREAAD